MTRAESLANDYASALQQYMAEQCEDALADAYDVARRALAQGIGIIDLAMLHDESLRKSPLGGDDESRKRAAQFFAEALSPFEMALRGYQESVHALESQNSDLRAAKVATDQANAELDAFSASVAHDLRSPLATVDGFCQLLQEQYSAELGERGGSWLTHMRDALHHMTQLIEDLLRFARASRMEVTRDAVDIASIAHEIIGRLRHKDRKRQVELVAPARLVAHADARLLVIVLDNLLSNAWKFTRRRERARIELGQEARAGEIVFFVRDDGAGFDMKHVGRLFGAFQRLHAGADFEGTGIGLATVARIVQRHGGRIWAEGAPDQGAAFYFTLAPREAVVEAHT